MRDDGVDRALEQLVSSHRTLAEDKQPITVFVAMHEGGFREAFAPRPVRLVFVNDTREYGREVIELAADQTVIKTAAEIDQMIAANPADPNPYYERDDEENDTDGEGDD